MTGPELLMVAAVRRGCSRVAPPPHFLSEAARPSDTHGMEPLASVRFATSGGSRPAGWQAQVRVDYVVNKVSQTHRGMSEDAVAQAIQDQLRAVGVVPNGRMIAQYASAISALPQLPPKSQ
jgi:hypothetical protein